MIPHTTEPAATAGTPPPSGPVLVLLGGGIDSTACVEFYRQADRGVTGLFVDYGQAAATAERAAVRRVASHYKIPLTELTLAGGPATPGGLVTGRNAFFLSTALVVAGQQGVGTVAIGVHHGTDYSDCSRAFIATMEELFRTSSDGAVQLDAPFVEWFKFQIWDFAQRHAVPLHLTYSCQRGTLPPCGSCLSCNDRWILENVEQRAGDTRISDGAIGGR